VTVNKLEGRHWTWSQRTDKNWITSQWEEQLEYLNTKNRPSIYLRITAKHREPTHRLIIQLQLSLPRFIPRQDLDSE